MRIYMIAGDLEGEGGEQVTDMNAMYNTLLSAGFSEEEVVAISHPDGQHSEWYWAREFPAAYEWLFRGSVTADKVPDREKMKLKVFPNPSDSNFQLIIPALLVDAEFDILSSDGRNVQNRRPLKSGPIGLEGLEPGIYFLRAFNDGKLVGVLKLMRQ